MAAGKGSQVRLISPPPEGAHRTLPYEINARTKEVHDELNKLITTRLPLALPPNTDTPVLYLHGIHTFAQLYIAFEDAWQDLIHRHLAASQHFDEDGHATASANLDAASSSRDDRLRSYLATLIPPSLWRSTRAEADIAYLRAKFSADHPLPVLDNDAVLTRWTTHIADTIEAKPHVLLAYAWVLYMAIFSGGRWIRAQLRDAGPAFWGEDKEAGISLFSFDGGEDGEDLKAKFKQQLVRADELLTDEQRREVVVEGGRIFDACVDLVHHLDARLGNPGGVAGLHGGGQAAELSGKQGKSTTTISAGEEAGLLVKDGRDDPLESASTIIPEGPGSEFITTGVNPFVAGIVIALGIGFWYMLHTYGPWTRFLSYLDDHVGS